MRIKVLAVLSIGGFAALGSCAKIENLPYPVDPSPVIVRSVEVTPRAVEISVGQTSKLTYKVLPVDAADKSIVWSSIDATVATVDQRGEVMALAEGEAKIVVRAKSNSLCDTCTVTILPAPQPPQPL